MLENILYRAEELGGTERQSEEGTLGYYIWIRYGSLYTSHIHHEYSQIKSFRVLEARDEKTESRFGQ
jgi:hypothetical protein